MSKETFDGDIWSWDLQGDTAGALRDAFHLLFLHTHCSSLCKSKYTFETNVKSKNQDWFPPPLSFIKEIYALWKTKYTFQTNMHKKEWVTLSSSFFLHTHCSILCKTKYSYQTNVQKNKNPNIFRFRLLFPPQTVKYFSFHCKNSHSVKLLSWAIRFTPHSMKQFLFVKHTRKHRTRGRALPLLFLQPALLCEMFLLWLVEVTTCEIA